MRKSFKKFIRYSFGQVASLRAHELNQRAPHRVWLDYLCDQASVRLGGGRPQVCDFLGNNKLALTSYTAPGVHYSRVGCMHDYEEINFFRHALAPGDVFLDVGANAGSFSVVAISRGCSKVIAFEPSPKTNWITRLNFSLNNASPGRHIVLPQALGRGLGKALITTHLGGTDRFLLAQELLANPSAATVDVVTVDSLSILPGVAEGSFLGLKIDVEGFDLDVLIGAKDTLQSSPLALVCVEGNKDEVEIRDSLVSLGFTQVRYDIDSTSVVKSDDFTPNRNGLFVKGFSELMGRLSRLGPSAA